MRELQRVRDQQACAEEDISRRTARLTGRSEELHDATIRFSTELHTAQSASAVGQHDCQRLRLQVANLEECVRQRSTRAAALDLECRQRAEWLHANQLPLKK